VDVAVAGASLAASLAAALAAALAAGAAVAALLPVCVEPVPQAESMDTAMNAANPRSTLCFIKLLLKCYLLGMFYWYNMVF
jgi:hypothetical protein